MDIFGNSQMPGWMTPSQFSLASEQASESIGRNFGSAFNAAASRKQEGEQFAQSLALKERALDADIAFKRAQTIGELNKIDDASALASSLTQFKADVANSDVDAVLNYPTPSNLKTPEAVNAFERFRLNQVEIKKSTDTYRQKAKWEGYEDSVLKQAAPGEWMQYQSIKSDPTIDQSAKDRFLPLKLEEIAVNAQKRKDAAIAPPPGAEVSSVTTYPSGGKQVTYKTPETTKPTKEANDFSRRLALAEEELARAKAIPDDGVDSIEKESKVSQAQAAVSFWKSKVSAPASGAAVKRYNPQTGKIE